MVPPVALSALLLVAAASAAPAVGDGRSVIAVSESGIMHLDQSGELIAWRPEVFQWWQGWHVATNPRNGTVCWVSAHEDQNLEASLRCAPVASLNETWELPQPRGFRLNLMDALAFDWLNENWYLTTSRVSYVCTYLFDSCVKLAEAGGNVRFFAAYDISSRLMFRIATEGFGEYKLQVLNLDGTDLRELPTTLIYPAGLAVDPVGKHVYILDSKNTLDVEIYSVNYAGEDKRLIAERDERFSADWQRSIDVIDGDIVVSWDDQTTVTRVSVADGKAEDLVPSAVRGQTLPALAKVEKLLAVRIVSPETQPDQVGNACEATECQHICVPTAVNATAGATCFCPEGEALVDLTCYKRYPAYVVVAGADSLQAVDLQTEEATEILSGLANVTDLAFYLAGDDEYLLFWLDDSGVSRGTWSPGQVVLEPTTVVAASQKAQIMGIAIDWKYRHLIWLENDPSIRYGKSVTIKLAPFDGSYVKSLRSVYGQSHRGLSITGGGVAIVYAVDSWGDWEFESVDMDGKSYYLGFTLGSSNLLKSAPGALVIRPPLGTDWWTERPFWTNATAKSIEVYGRAYMFASQEHQTVLTHPSLADAGGLAVLDLRLFWTERSTGRLWTADTRTDDEPRALPVQTGGRAVRVLHPWVQPTSVKPLCDQQRNGCSHFCVMSLVNLVKVGRCACPDGQRLGSDKKTCE